MARSGPTYQPSVLLLAVGCCGLGLLLESFRPGAFAHILGPAPAAAVLLLSGGLAPVLAAVVVRANRSFVPGDSKATARAFAWLPVFALSITLLDLAAPFSPEINVALPEALLFYPSMALVAEVLLHLLPLSLWCLLPRVGHRGLTRGQRTSMVALVAATEPTFQALLGHDPNRPPWAEALTYLHIYGLNIVWLRLLLQRGLPATLALRLAYYAYWHLLYGQVRLLWLVPAR